MNLVALPPSTKNRLERADLSPDQREAYDTIVSWVRGGGGEVLSLGGFAGTGKSELLGLLAREEGLGPIAFTAYTGKASSVLKKKLARGGVATRDRLKQDERSRLPYCGTIHGLVYVPVTDSETDKILRWTLRDTLDAEYALLCVDEASMLGDEALGHLRSYGVPILLVGDHGQLPPVGVAGNWMKDPDIRLEKIHRQAEGNPLIRIAAGMRQTGRLDLSLAEGDPRVRFERISGLRSVLEERYQGVQETKDLVAKVTIVYTNRRRAEVNRLTREILGKKAPIEAGDQVIALKNDRESGVTNGMRGLLATVEGPSPTFPWQIRGRVDFTEDDVTTRVSLCGPQFGHDKTVSDLSEGEKLIKAAGFKPRAPVTGWYMLGDLYDHGYAVTGHKMQGAQCEDVLLICERPWKVTEDDWKKWMYSCITRATQRITVLM